ncbi:hypothetical protein M378DRAFT_183937 [Amanita muscaria Koide BX008]|uniref:non-specific serine/threonine protein kinase n=1 Tax=Amanita muscaria (strain Koide BX008) TaxID=946122 RepID=A0A0C2XMW1_AMAMK|nr:hypothetical protein M378DRAFT_183937 [Amanita muscaria Koide BX008]
MESDDELLIQSQQAGVVSQPLHADMDEDQDPDQEQEQPDDNDNDNDDNNDQHNLYSDLVVLATDEETTLQLKPKDEQEDIEEEIHDLMTAVPQVAGDYKIIDRLGTGTFSSVYKAIDLGYHDKWDNSPWHGHHLPTSSAYYQSAPKPQESKVFVAIKRIYVTSNPERIRNEISIMEDCRGCRHVSQLITAFRHHDQVVAIMPYHRNEDFRDFYKKLPLPGIKAYFRCMFRALRDVHAREIIHRDVKPANFLFDPRAGVGTLCDFGLACRIEPGQTQGACLHTPASKDHPHGRIRNRNELDFEDIKRAQKEARQKCSWPSDRVGYLAKDSRPVSKANRAGTRGFRAPEVLLKCGDQTGAVDMWSAGMILLFFLTGKFPLFQSNDDVEAFMEIAAIIGRRKMEKAATLHSRTFSTNVPSISHEGITWRDFVQRQNPHLYEPHEPDSQYFPYYGSPPSLVSAARKQKSDLPTTTSSSSSASSYPTSSSLDSLSNLPRVSSPTEERHRVDIENALDLVEQLMHPESTRRITPRAALYHPFLANDTWGGEGTAEGVRYNGDEVVVKPGNSGRKREDNSRSELDADEGQEGVGDDDEGDETGEAGGRAGDDEFFPHPFGEGVCGEWHFQDASEEPCVSMVQMVGECECGRCERDGGEKKGYEERLRLVAGQGIAIGREPCEFHAWI